MHAVLAILAYNMTSLCRPLISSDVKAIRNTFETLRKNTSTLSATYDVQEKILTLHR